MSTLIEERNLDTAEAASIDLVALNNELIGMRKAVNKSKVQVINKLSRQIKQLKNKKGTDEQKLKNIQKAERILEEIEIVKILKPDKISKFALANTTSFLDACKKNSSLHQRALARLADNKWIAERVKQFRLAHNDWVALSAFLSVKDTGRRIKKKKEIPRPAKVITNVKASKTLASSYLESKFPDDCGKQPEEIHALFQNRKKNLKLPSKQNVKEENTVGVATDNLSKQDVFSVERLTQPAKKVKSSTLVVKSADGVVDKQSTVKFTTLAINPADGVDDKRGTVRSTTSTVNPADGVGDKRGTVKSTILAVNPADGVCDKRGTVKSTTLAVNPADGVGDKRGTVKSTTLAVNLADGVGDKRGTVKYSTLLVKSADGVGDKQSKVNSSTLVVKSADGVGDKQSKVKSSTLVVDSFDGHDDGQSTVNQNTKSENTSLLVGQTSQSSDNDSVQDDTERFHVHNKSKETVVCKIRLDQLDENQTSSSPTPEFIFQTTSNKSISLPDCDSEHAVNYRRKKDSFFLGGESSDEGGDRSDCDSVGSSGSSDHETEKMKDKRQRQNFESLFMGSLSERNVTKPKSNNSFEKRRSMYYEKQSRGRQSFSFEKDDYRKRKSFTSLHNRPLTHGRSQENRKFERKNSSSSNRSLHNKQPTIHNTGPYTERQGKRKENEGKTEVAGKSDSKEKIHPSWEASKRKKEMQSHIQAYQGKKIKFDDD